MKYLVRGQNTASMTMCSHDGPKQEGGRRRASESLFCSCCSSGLLPITNHCATCLQTKKSQAWKECDDVSWGKVVILLRPVIMKGIVNVVGSLLCVCGCRQNAIVNLWLCVCCVTGAPPVSPAVCDEQLWGEAQLAPPASPAERDWELEGLCVCVCVSSAFF